MMAQRIADHRVEAAVDAQQQADGDGQEDPADRVARHPPGQDEAHHAERDRTERLAAVDLRALPGQHGQRHQS
jgi:hypothetical protein